MDFKLVSDYAPMGDQPEALVQLVSTLEREFRIQGNRHTQTVVANAKIRRRSRHRNFYAHSNSPHFVST